MLGAIQTQRGKWTEGESLLRQGLALDPTEPDVLYNLSILLTTTARFKEALEISEKLRTLEPFVPNYNITVAGNMLMSGNAEAAIAILEATPPEAAGGYYRAITLAQAYAVKGRLEDAAGAFLAMPDPNVVSRSSVEAADVIHNAADDTAPPDPLPLLEGGLAFVYGFVGAPERVLDFAERVREITGGGTIPFIWSPAYESARRTQRFKAHIRAVGLLAHWRAHGWPEICRPVGAHDFACD